MRRRFIYWLARILGVEIAFCPLQNHLVQCGMFDHSQLEGTKLP